MPLWRSESVPQRRRSWQAQKRSCHLSYSSRSPPITRCSICRPDTLRISLRCQVWQSRHVGINNLCIAVCPCSPARPPLLRSRCVSSNLLYHPSLSTVTATFRLPRFQRTPILPLRKPVRTNSPIIKAITHFPPRSDASVPFRYSRVSRPYFLLLQKQIGHCAIGPLPLSSAAGPPLFLPPEGRETRNGVKPGNTKGVAVQFKATGFPTSLAASI